MGFKGFFVCVFKTIERMLFFTVIFRLFHCVTVSRTKYFSLISSLTFWKSTIFLIACIIFPFCTPIYSWREMFLRYFETKFWWNLKIEWRSLKLYFFLLSTYKYIGDVDHHYRWKATNCFTYTRHIQPLSSDSSF